MNLKLEVGLLKRLTLNEDVLEEIGSQLEWRRDEQLVECETDWFTDDDVAAIKLFCGTRHDINSVTVMKRLATFEKLRASGGGTVVARLEPLAEAFKQLIGATPNKWLFHQKSDGHTLPYLVTSVAYHPPARLCPAQTRVDLCYVMRGEKKDRTLIYVQHEIRGQRTPEQLLNGRGFYVETEQAVDQYSDDMATFKQFSGDTGEQFTAVGVAEKMNAENRYYSCEITSMVCEGVPTKVVMDDDSDEAEGRRDKAKVFTESGRFWTGLADSSVTIPLHPYVKVFDLSKHYFVKVHTNDLTRYVYHQNLADKLVLSAEKKDLVSLLVQGASDLLEDIVAGKTGGVIIFATGEPGTGKTLTGEVYAETICRPLYVVQCSQLGVDEETLEKRLRVVLARAMRWKAILLIDEADVYVHERGSDIHQNAIVGVFLRVLEYYRGVLFLTSNRAIVVDDAIMSRATAHIRYDLPTTDELTQIWTVLSAQYEVKFTAKQVRELVEHFPTISGRNVKNLLKLSRMLAAKRKQPVDLALVQHVSRFIDLAKKP